jgi:hypothetical protein
MIVVEASSGLEDIWSERAIGNLMLVLTVG